MADGPTRRSSRTNVTKSYRNSFGAPAPQGNIHQPASAASNNPGLIVKKKLRITGGILTYTRLGEALSPGAWCSNCRNGGTLVVCNICKLNSLCTNCIDVNIDDEDLDFQCPPCFLKKDNKAIYPWTLKAATTAREHWPKNLTTPLAIISIHLENMADTPSLLAYHHLQPWLKGNIVHVDLDFNLTDVSHNDWAPRFNNMLEAFETGPFRDWTQFFVFITSHSDPTNGYLHIAPDNAASVPVNELFNVILTDRFKHILQRSENNLLNLLSCGALSGYQESRNTIKEIANYRIFDKILCFSQADFQPSSTHKFVMDWALTHFVFGRKNIQQFLQEHQALGAHTDIVQFQPGITKTFKWTHVGARPLGFGINGQCTSCKRLKTKTPKPTEDRSKIDHSNIVIRCSACKSEEAFAFPSGWQWTHGPPNLKDERGAWLVQNEVEEEKK